MTSNLVTSIMQSLTPDMIAKIASLLGLDRGAAQKAISAGIPAILASFASLAAKPDGARQLSSTLGQQPPGAFDRFRNAIGGSEQATLAESGAGLMSGLIGSGGLNALAAAIGSFAGIGSNSGKSLVGMLGPVVAGALGHEQRSAGLDANGLASLLASQKDQIAAAMPPGLTKVLSAAGALGAVDGGLRRTADAATAAGARMAGFADDAYANTGQAAYAASGGGTSSTTWPLWVAGFVALVGLGWYFSGHENSQLAERQAAPATQPSATVGSRTPDIVTAAELKSELSASVSAVRVAILGMTNSTTANAALPQLQQAAARLDRVNVLVGELPPAARQGVANALAPTAARLNQLFDKILSSPEVASVAKPTVDEVRSKLAALSRT